MNKLLIFIFLAFISCKKEVTEDKVKDTSSEILNSDELFQENLLNKPKFFLKYWEGMAYEDFIKVSQLLCDEGILDSYSLTYNAPETHFKYLIGNGDGLDVNPIFSKDNNQSTLVGVSIRAIDDLYPIFKEKYNLPNLKMTNTLKSCYIERNPFYNPVTTYFDGDINVVARIDNSEQLRVNQVINIDINDENYNKKFLFEMLPRNEIIIEKDDGVIILSYDSSFTNENRYEKLYQYSLDNYNDETFFWGTKESKQNSKNRIVYENVTRRTIIANFFGKEYYNTIKKKEEELILRNQNENIEINKRNLNRKNNISDEL